MWDWLFVWRLALLVVRDFRFDWSCRAKSPSSPSACRELRDGIGDVVGVDITVVKGKDAFDFGDNDPGDEKEFLE